MSLAELNAAISRAVSDVPDCIAAGFVDVDSGLLLAIKAVDSRPEAIIELAAAATADLFQGRNVVAIEQDYKKSRGLDNNDHYFQEILVNSKNLLHVFLRSPRQQNHVLILVCRKSVNLGMALSKARAVLPTVEMAI